MEEQLILKCSKDVQKDVKVQFNITILRSRILPILRLVAAGNYSARVAVVLGLGRFHVHSYLKRLEGAGLVRRQGPKYPVFYDVTGRCSNFLDGIERSLTPGPVVRLNHAAFKYPILAGPSQGVYWRRVELTNRSRLLGREGGLTVRKNPEILCLRHYF